MKLITELGKFKVGDYWRARNGMKVLIYAISPLITIWPIQACCEENGEKFNLLLREDGSVSGEGIKMPCDLIEPWIDEPECKFKVGELWESRNGSIWKIREIEKRGENDSCVLAAMHFSISHVGYFEIDGRYSGFYKHDNDLIKPWIEPELELELGELYELNNGMKGFCYKITADRCCISVSDIKNVLIYLKDGTYVAHGIFMIKNSPFNIKCKWKDK